MAWADDYCAFIIGLSILTFFLKLPWYYHLKAKADEKKAEEERERKIKRFESGKLVD